MGQANCCQGDQSKDKNNTIDMDEKSRADKKKKEEKKNRLVAKARSIRADKQNSSTKEIMKKITSNLLSPVRDEVIHQNTAVTRDVNDNDPESFLPNMPALKEVGFDEKAHEYIKQARKVTKAYFEKLKDDKYWELYKDEDGLELSYCKQDAREKFLVKRVLEVNCPVLEAANYIHDLKTAKYALYDCKSLKKIENIGYGSTIIKYMTKGKSTVSTREFVI